MLIARLHKELQELNSKRKKKNLQKPTWLKCGQQI
jgi:hypothetical protein